MKSHIVFSAIAIILGITIVSYLILTKTNNEQNEAQNFRDNWGCFKDCNFYISSSIVEEKGAVTVKGYYFDDDATAENKEDYLVDEKILESKDISAEFIENKLNSKKCSHMEMHYEDQKYGPGQLNSICK